MGELIVGGNRLPNTPYSLVFIPALTSHAWHSDDRQLLKFRCAYFDWKYTERPLVKHRYELFIMNPTEPLDIREEYVSPVLDIELPLLRCRPSSISFVNGGQSDHRLYVDGELVESSTEAWAYNTQTSQPLEIGRFKNHTFGTTYFNGAIDEVQIHPAVLNDEEILAMYNGY